MIAFWLCINDYSMCSMLAQKHLQNVQSSLNLYDWEHFIYIWIYFVRKNVWLGQKTKQTANRKSQAHQIRNQTFFFVSGLVFVDFYLREKNNEIRVEIKLRWMQNMGKKLPFLTIQFDQIGCISAILIVYFIDELCGQQKTPMVYWYPYDFSSALSTDFITLVF